jgi:hypothetical protein
MQAEPASVRVLRIAAGLVAAGAILSGPVAMAVVQLFAPQPTWSDVATFADHFSAVQTLPYLLGFGLLGGFVLFSAAVHAVAAPDERVRASAAMIWTAVYAALVFTNYTIQLGFVPRMVPARPAYLAALTMANPASFAWFLEMFGYAAIGVATWLVAPMFGGTRRADLIRYLLVANGVMSIAGAACTALADSWVFSPSGLASFAAWNVLIPACFVLIALTPGAGLRFATASAR